MKKSQSYGPTTWNGLYPTKSEERWDAIQSKRHIREEYTLKERIGLWFGYGMYRTKNPSNTLIPLESEAAAIRKIGLTCGFNLTPEQVKMYHQKSYGNNSDTELQILFSVLNDKQRLQFRQRYQ